MLGVHPRLWFYRYVRGGKHSLLALSLPPHFKELCHRARPWMNIFEAKALYDLAKKNVGLGVIVEVGSALGGSACLLSHASKEINGEKTYCIDPWQEAYWSKETEDSGNKQVQISFGAQAESIGSPHQKFLANIKENGVPALVEAIRGESQVVAKNWGKPIKLLFIDGSHDYADVVTDIKSWEPYVVTNGILVFHDYSAKH